MKITISNETTWSIVSVDIPGSLLLEDFQAYLQAETDVTPEDQIILKDGAAISGDRAKSISELGFADGDLLVLQSKQSLAAPAITLAPALTLAPSQSTYPTPQSGIPQANSSVDAQAEEMRNRILSDPTLNSQVAQTNPHLHSLLHQPSAFKDALVDMMQQYSALGGPGSGPGAGGNQEEMRRLQQNPDDPENQARILELIQQEQIEENMQLAYDISPESFTSVNMLYIDFKINGQKVKAFVDSGAQSTIISPRLAEKVGISRLIDKRFKGEARGVGSQKIEGKIHSVTITIGDSETPIPCSFIVLQTDVDLLFGLDMLRRHKCIIDLERDVLVVGGNIETKFLHELEIPKGGIFGGGNTSVSNTGNVLGSSEKKAPSTPSTASNAAAQAATNRQNRQQSLGPSSPFSEEDITRLLGLGFSRPEAIQALEVCQGNVEMAASMLFN